MAEKRKNERAFCAVPVDGKSGGIFAETQTVDISQTGLGFVSKHKIPVNREIAVELDLPEEEEPVLVIAKVCWSRQIKGTDQYRIGLNFENMFRGSKTRLKKYFQKST